MRLLARVITTTTLTGIAALHAAWATGSAFPFATREELADTVVGSPEFPGANACWTVTALAGTGALLVAVQPRTTLVRLAHRGVAATLLARAIIGGRTSTQLLGLPEPSRAFLDADKKIYRPLCLTLGVGAWVSASPARQ
ncbi:DUF3995 domain-containing protein [Jonesia denitrificans]|uniref:DUF3995 domain-containing protein n=1 Tax=Jonesia denitrificans (strain ATCC 14870 / DSM 20603 / BCRC 15368 / CIP 55.134 / JCM 11481 / NBRC 15587 / NCTC 10816 / Prevot 55134) TaxID=471856 RepID=C7R3V4_JONDD|nr:DUF3995 domain-containing protein [Jonesia denitrificans]ACV08811.1 conserved hypothetical protein [Jonesia denitrificans DSM 20603]ASE09868.1 DUF3995 domain-containing protein [Jonesia denitrificans]QXB44404.1 DUF3995 domain-containing protein [Jonesia denitrificans]SQH20800.1 Uncharacterised protein [Jonesia denitrificans]